jgi:endonuclease YncB( thermonuclease family)
MLPEIVLAAALLAIDGDTIEIQGERIRLENVDTPELNGKCDAEKMLARVAKLASKIN